MSTFGNPGRYACCFGEHEEASPWESLSVEHGFASADSTIAALPGEPLQIVNDTRSRRAPDLLTTIARSLAVIAHHKATELGDTLVLLGPEHARTIADDGWPKARARQFLWELCRRPVRDLVPGRDGGDGLPERLLASFPDPANDTTLVPKFRAPENLKLIVAGGTAGRFTALVPGWPFPNAPTQLVIRKIQRPA
jgi:hypothetical protein